MALSSELRSMLDKIEAGDLEASTSMRYRIEGAVEMLDVALGRSTRSSFQLPPGEEG